MSDVTRILIAPDSFKESLPAYDVCAAISAGVRSACSDVQIDCAPMADGGEGTLSAIRLAYPSAVTRTKRVTGPSGIPVDAEWLEIREVASPDVHTAVIELAKSSGIELLHGAHSPWDAGTFGFGELIAAALDAGATRLILTIGSSASTDGGIGMLQALGAQCLDSSGHPVESGLRGLMNVRSIDISRLRPAPADGVLVLTDVINPLVGAQGSAAVYGPQKGLPSDAIGIADVALAHWARLIGVDAAAVGSGAAGGTGAALLAWGAQLTPGAEVVADLVGLRQRMASADLVVTGEGQFDRQSQSGKVCATVAKMAHEAGIPIALIAGRIDTDVSGFVASQSLIALAGTQDRAITDAAHWVFRAAESITGRLVAAGMI